MSQHFLTYLWQDSFTCSQIPKDVNSVRLAWNVYENTFYRVRTYSNMWTNHVTQANRQTHIWMYENTFTRMRTHSSVWEHILTYTHWIDMYWFISEHILLCETIFWLIRIELIYIGTYQNTFYGVKTYSNIYTSHVTQPTHCIDIYWYISEHILWSENAF